MRNLPRAKVLTERRNRFVRFGYRRPPPWTSNDLKPTSTKPSRCSSFDVDHSSWAKIINPNIPLVPITTNQDSSIVPGLAHGIETVLQGDGVYPLEAPWTLSHKIRTAKRPHLNYNDSLRKIVQPDRIAWTNIPDYVSADKDTRLHTIASEVKGTRYCSSTSSMTPAIAALYHLLSNFRNTELTGGLSSNIDDLPSYFAKMHRRPVAFLVNPVKEDLFSVSAHSGPDGGPTILQDLGHSMERMLTNDPDAFASKYVLDSSTNHPSSASLMHSALDEEQFFHYSKVSSFVLRAQIDCRNERTGEVFDVKTRAVAPIRYDLDNYHSSRSHRLRRLTGKIDSYEREFYDMVRSVFLKYALQLRIGRMSGALIAYHNTTEVLGLEYISLSEIYSYVFGGQRWADHSFSAGLHLLEKILDKATKSLLTGSPDEYLKVVLSTEWSRLKMNVFVQRLTRAEQDKDRFSSSVFLQTEENRVQDSNIEGDSQASGLSTMEFFQCCELWHYDSDLHTGGRGVAVIGDHNAIGKMGGKIVEKQKIPLRNPRRGFGDALNHQNYATDSLSRENFRMYELEVAPLVNEETKPRPMIQLEEDDIFTLKYKLEEVTKPDKEHFAKFVSSLGRVYMPRS